MKKLIYIAGAALVMLASASCEKKETVKEAQSSVEKVDMVFTATSGSGALKTTIVDGTKAVWSATDNLIVFTAEDTHGSMCKMTDPKWAGTATAEFAGQCAKKGPWTAICPAIEGATYSAGTITFTMPETQTYAANTFADGAMPCVAYSETNTFNFKHSFGVLKLSLKLMEGKTGSVQSITVTDKGGKQLWGTFTVNPRTSEAATYSTGGASSIILDCGTGVALSESTATDFWIVVPEGAFEGGFDVTVTSTSGDLLPATLSTTKANTIKVGEVNKMPVQTVEFKLPTTGYAAVKSGTGITGDKVKWVQLWKDGPKWAEFNVGATTAIGESSYGEYYGWGGSTNKSNSDYANKTEVTTDIQYDPKWDTARKKWGDNWQMAKKADFDNLLANCDVEAKSETESGYGVAGLLCTGKTEGYTDNSVFFPAAGSFTSGQVRFVGTTLYCWSSTPNAVNSCYYLFYSNNTTPCTTYNSRYNGYPVRAILHE